MKKCKDWIIKHIRNEQYAEAREILVRHKSDLHVDADFLCLKAEIALGLERFDEAFDCYIETLNHDKESVIAKAGLLRLADYIDIGKTQDSLFNDIEDSTEPEVCLGKSIYLSQKGKLADAVRVLSDAYYRYDDDLRILSEYITVLIMNNIDDPRIEPLFNKKHINFSQKLLENKILYLYKIGDYYKCEVEAKRIIIYHPGTPASQRAYEVLRKIKKNRDNNANENQYIYSDTAYNGYNSIDGKR